jgi:hypothetical protein
MSRYFNTGNLIVGALGLTAIGKSVEAICTLQKSKNNDKSCDILSLDNYEVEITTRDGNYGCPKDKRYTYYDPKTKKEIGFIDFTPKTGQIGFWGIYEDYRHKTLGKQMIDKIIPELKKNDVNKIYGYSDSEEIKHMSETNNKIKRIKRNEGECDYYEMDI